MFCGVDKHRESNAKQCQVKNSSDRSWRNRIQCSGKALVEWYMDCICHSENLDRLEVKYQEGHILDLIGYFKCWSLFPSRHAFSAMSESQPTRL